MKATSTHLFINNNGYSSSISTKQPSKNHRYYQNCNQVAVNINRNATISQSEYERNACEAELYRLRYGIENLLANRNQDDFVLRQQQRLRTEPNPFRTTRGYINNFNYRKNESWLSRCSRCCRRRRRRTTCDDDIIPNENTYYRDRCYDISPHRTTEYSYPSQLHSDAFVSNVPSSYIDPDMNHVRRESRHDIDHLINRNRPINRSDISNLLLSKDFNDPAYNALMVKILEKKALDCLCSDYSKQTIENQITKELSKLNLRVNQDQQDFVSITSSQSSPALSDSSSVSPIIPDDRSVDPLLITPQLSSPEIFFPSSSIFSTPNIEETTLPIISPYPNQQRIQIPLKSIENIKVPKKESKVTIVNDETPNSNKSKTRKKSSSKRKPSAKSSSKKQRKPSKSKQSSSKRTSSKLKKKGSSRSKTGQKSKSKKSRSTSRKKTKPKSNNQMNERAGAILSLFTYPQEEIYRNRRRS